MRACSRLAPLSVALASVASLSWAPPRSASVRLARSRLPLSSRIEPIIASVRSARAKLARLASASNSIAMPSLALLKSAWIRSVLLRLAPVRSAPEKFAPRSTERWKLAPARLAPARLAPARFRRFRLAPARLHPGQSLAVPARKAAASCASATVPEPNPEATMMNATAKNLRMRGPFGLIEQRADTLIDLSTGNQGQTLVPGRLWRRL